MLSEGVAVESRTGGSADQSRPTCRRLRVGFLSRSFYSHSVGRLTAGLIRHLARKQFHVTVFTSDVPEDSWWQRIRDGADAVVRLPSPASNCDHLAEARRIIGGEQLDVLYFADIIMDPWAYFLAFSRLAPVQCTSWGHPITTGIPTMDYYLSARDLEPPDAAEHYSERLVIFDNLPSYFYRLPAPEGDRSRRHFGLEEDAHLYVCAQSLFKLHPELDSMFDGILRADPRGRIVLIAGHREYWTKIILNRLSGTLGENVKRVVVLPRQSGEDFRHLLKLADVVLDPIHFGSGVSAYETLALGTPLVTLPGGFMRGRIVYGCYRRMGIGDCIAADAEDYVRIAVRLGNDPAWRADIRRRILAANGVLFENRGIIQELEQFFLTARQQASTSAEDVSSCR